MKHTRTMGVVAMAATLALLTGCTGTAASDSAGGDVIRVAGFDGGYGAEMYTEVVAAYEKANPDVKIELTTSKTLADELTPKVAAGDFPDLVVLALGGKEGFTESFVRDGALEDLTGVLDETIPGEDVTVGDKLTDGIVGNLSTDPYGDGKTYLMPMYASPTGLVYDKGLFESKGWDVPTTWDEMFALGDTAKAEGLSLFTYPTSGYLDSYFFSLLSTVGGDAFLNDVLTYKKDIWKSAEATEALELTAKLLQDYSAPTTVGYANNQDFSKNQQTILDGKTLFMPNGTWIANEMKDAPRVDGFAWGLAPVPAPTEGGDRYLNTFVEAAWMPKEATNKEGAKHFLAYLYSDEAADIFAKAGAIQPIQGLPERLTGEAKDFYAQYNEPGVKAVVAAFAGTQPVPGVDLKATLFDSANSIISGDLTLEKWQDDVNTASNKLTGKLAG